MKAVSSTSMAIGFARAVMLCAALVLCVAPSAMAQVGANRDGLVNANLGTAEELGAIPQLGEAAVAAIIGGRPYLTMAAVHAVVTAHIAAEDIEELYRRFWLPINLNDVTDAEVRLIPGVGDRMAHEFDEYAPYAGLPVFHREIAKYVDDDELARLAQYVFVPLKLNSATSEQFQTIPGVGGRMAHEFDEYRPWRARAQFEREIGKYVDEDEVARLWRYVVIEE
jgi:DNA uptake protein ComE-like DNA-binding protein